jgi:hypothetical protein
MPGAFNDQVDKTMITQRNRIFELLPQYGWEVKNVEDHLRNPTGLDWFIDELWEVESVWSPNGLRIWVTFVVDPQTSKSDDRKKGEDVWAVKAGLRKPLNDEIEDDDVYLSLNGGWENRLPEFFSRLSDLRKEVMGQTLA